MKLTKHYRRSGAKSKEKVNITLEGTRNTVTQAFDWITAPLFYEHNFQLKEAN